MSAELEKLKNLSDLCLELAELKEKRRRIVELETQLRRMRIDQELFNRYIIELFKSKGPLNHLEIQNYIGEIPGWFNKLRSTERSNVIISIGKRDSIPHFYHVYCLKEQRDEGVVKAISDVLHRISFIDAYDFERWERMRPKLTSIIESISSAKSLQPLLQEIEDLYKKTRKERPKRCPRCKGKGWVK